MKTKKNEIVDQDKLKNKIDNSKSHKTQVVEELLNIYRVSDRNTVYGNNPSFNVMNVSVLVKMTIESGKIMGITLDKLVACYNIIENVKDIIPHRNHFKMRKKSNVHRSATS